MPTATGPRALASLPNLLIIGAPRCGTTSLHDWLVAHPAIGGSRRKETFYMMDRESFEFVPDCNVHDRGLEGYAHLFDSCADRAVRLESTTGYLYQQTAFERLPDLPTHPRFVVVLREPASRVLSTFRYFQGHKGQLPDEMDFRGFVDAVDAGSPVVRRNEFLADAVDHSRYATHLARWRERVGADRLRVVLFDDLRADPCSTVTGLARWAGVESGFYDTYSWPHRNESYSVRYPRLHRCVRRSILPLVANEAVKRGLRRLYIGVVGRRSTPTDPTEKDVLRDLRARFAEDNQRLAKDWDLDLTRWTRS